MTDLAVESRPKTPRLMSLDALRGMTIAGMLLVNNPGSWNSDNIYWPLEHAAWNGWTFTDLIFPFFLFMVGVAMMFSFPKRLERGETKGSLFSHVIRRAVVLFLLGMFSLPHMPDSSEGFFHGLHTIGFWPNVTRWATVWAFLCAIVLITGTKRPLVWFIGYLIGAAVLFLGAMKSPLGDAIVIFGFDKIHLRLALEVVVIGSLIAISFPKAKRIGQGLLVAGAVATLFTLDEPSLIQLFGVILAVLVAFAIFTQMRPDPVGRFVGGGAVVIGILMVVIISAQYDPIWSWLTNRRLTGVLPRIGFCYLIASAIYFATPSPKAIIAWIVALLSIYWIWMLYIPIPGFGTPDLTMGFPTRDTPVDQLFSNWCFYIDYHVLGEHVWGVRTLHDSEGLLIWSFDPEGVLSTMSAVCSVLFGILTGLWLQRRETSATEKTNSMFIWGCALATIGIILSIWMPINKRIWTSTYTVFMAGMALLCLGMCYHLIDVKGYRKWAMPFVWFGMNAITAFFFSGQMAVMLGRLKVKVVDEAGAVDFISWKGWIFDHLCNIMEPINASLTFAVGFVLFWAIIMGIMYRFKIFLKI